jgi:hypothetical protein
MKGATGYVWRFDDLESAKAFAQELALINQDRVYEIVKIVVTETVVWTSEYS